MDEALREDAEYDALVPLILRRKREGQRIAGSVRMNERLLREVAQLVSRGGSVRREPERPRVRMAR